MLLNYLLECHISMTFQKIQKNFRSLHLYSYFYFRELSTSYCCSIFNERFAVTFRSTACLLYHFVAGLSRGFQNFFQVSFRHFRSLQVAFSASFLRSPCLSLPFGHRLPCGALLYYHFLLLLSTPFFTFFQLFRAFFSTFRAFYPFFRGFGGLDRVFNGF